jgi:site-specific DNA-methyltransferase (adenine-specific)
LFYTKSEEFTFNRQFIPHPPGYTRRGGGENPQGTALDDVWTDIYSVWIMSFSKEKLSWPTQKPLALLERILKASSKENDVVLDPFCGCGTALVAAHELNRRWIGIDITHLAITVMKKRFRDHFGDIKFETIGEPVDVAGARYLAQQSRYQFQWWALSLVNAKPVGPARKKGADTGIDGVIDFVEARGKAQRIIVQVKSGHVDVSLIRDLKGVLEREQAAMGLFLTLEEPTKPMHNEALEAGFYQWELAGWKENLPKIQILTIEDLLKRTLPKLPRGAGPSFRQASRLSRELAEQPELSYEHHHI